MKTKILSILLLISAGFIACKKESASSQPKTTQEKILGKWNLITAVRNDYYSGASNITTFNYNSGDYIDFRNNGMAYGYSSNGYDTAAYGFINEKLWIENTTDQYDIKSLTETDMQLYIKYIYGTDYSESTVTLKK